MCLWLVSSLWLSGSAFAQETPDQAPTAAPAVAPTASVDQDGSRLGTNLRYRYLFLPKPILNGFYNDTADWTGEYANLERPSLSAHVIGLEFAVEPRPASFLFYVEYWKVNMEAGYWDDKDGGVQQQTDGDWLDPEKLGMVALGADFGHEFEVTDPSSDVWVGFRLGGGIGLGILTGHIDQWHPGGNISTEPTNNCLPDAHAIDRYDQCDPDETLTLPPVAPVLDLSLSWRFHIMDTGILRLDAGIHDMFYVGLAGGAVF